MTWRLKYNGNFFGGQSFKSYPEAAQYLRGLLKCAEGRYFSALRSKNQDLALTLKNLHLDISERVRIVQVEEEMVEKRAVGGAQGFERPRFASKHRNYIEIE